MRHPILPSLILLSSLTVAMPALAKIDRHAETASPITQPGGIRLSQAQSRQLCWLDGRQILDETDPFLMSFGLSGQPGIVVLQAPDGSRRTTTAVRRVPTACFAARQR
jgi:hypothetical protein